MPGFKHLLFFFLSLCALGVALFAPDRACAQAGERRLAIGPNDVLEIKVFQEADLDSKQRVSREGVIVFPLVGSVKVGGKSPEEAARLIRDLLAKDYLVNPQVSVSISEYDKRRFTVLGQVQKPGTYDMPDREAVTLLQAIGLAGGYTRIADPAKVTVKRRTEDRESVLRVDAKSMANGRSAGVFDVLPGDVITVGESIF